MISALELHKEGGNSIDTKYLNKQGSNIHIHNLFLSKYILRITHIHERTKITNLFLFILIFIDFNL